MEKAATSLASDGRRQAPGASLRRGRRWARGSRGPTRPRPRAARPPTLPTGGGASDRGGAISRAPSVGHRRRPGRTSPPGFTGLKMRKKGCASAPDPATHCQFATLFARSASTSVSQNQASPSPPVNEQVLGQEGSGDHAYSVVHPSRAPQFAHPRVHDRVTRAALLPGGQRPRLVAPRKVVEAGAPVLLHHVREVDEQVVAELAPCELAQERLRPAGSGAAGLDERGQDAPHPVGTDFAPVEVRGESRRGREIRPVPLVPIPVRGAVDEVRQTPEGPPPLPPPRSPEIPRPSRARSAAAASRRAPRSRPRDPGPAGRAPGEVRARGTVPEAAARRG